MSECYYVKLLLTLALFFCPVSVKRIVREGPANIMDLRERADDFMFHNLLCIKCDELLASSEWVAQPLDYLNKCQNILPKLHLQAVCFLVMSSA